MPAQSRERVMDWLRARPGVHVRLRVRGTAISVMGVSGGVEELDACSTEFNECELRSSVSGVGVSLTFHEDTLGLLVLITNPQDGEVVLSLPAAIAYEDALLEEVGEPEAPAQGDRAGAPSPYQLFHGD